MHLPLRGYLQLLTKYLRPQQRKVWLLVGLISVGLALQLAIPQVLRAFLDAMLAGTAAGRLSRLAGWFIALALTQQLTSGYGRYLGEDVGWTATNWLRDDLTEHCLQLDLAFHKTHPPGELIERIDGDVSRLSTFFSQLVIGLGSNLLLTLGVLVMLWRESWLVGLVLSLFSLVSLWVLNFTRQLAVPHLQADREKSSQYYGFLGEHLAGMEDIQANGSGGYVLQRFHRQVQEWLVVRMRANAFAATMWTSTVLMFGLMNALAFGLGALLWARGLASIGTIYLIVNYTGSLRRPIEQIRTHLQELQRAGASIGRVQRLLTTSSQVESGPQSLPAGDLAVEFRQVEFAYEPGEAVLSQLSFRLEPGQVLGLLGRTGSGKTTLARLLLRFHDPSSGQVLLAGIPSQQVDLLSLRRSVYLVTQEVQLFQASVRDNLTFFADQVSDQRVQQVLADVGLQPWLDSLPAGLDSELQSGARGLSAGEAQLLAFARCFLADPALVILDEASSRLDPATEQLVERAMDRLLQGRTAIIIAHRLATVQRADQVLILEQGRVIEQGDRRVLAADPRSRLWHLLRAGGQELLA